MFYWKDYRNINFPESRKEQSSTLDGINLRLGYLDEEIIDEVGSGKTASMLNKVLDNMNKGYVTLGDAPVHGLLVGSAGSGKSALLNFQIACLVKEYSSQELQIVLADFKGIESSFFKENTNIHVVDGSDTLQIFKRSIVELKEREERCSEIGVSHIKDYNLKTKGSKMPRVLLIVNDFVTLFKEASAEEAAELENDILLLSRYSRSFGLHMYFTTQEFSNCIPKSILNQFNLRICLRTSESLSKEMIGSEVAASITENGICYSNENQGQSQDTTKKWLFPLTTYKDFESFEVSNNTPETYMWKEYKELIQPGSTLYGINLRMGYERGDKSKPNYITLGDGTANCLAVGSAGSGKSALSYFQIASLLQEYSPEELQIMLLDYKNVDLSIYKDGPMLTVVNRNKISELFEYLNADVKFRTDLFAKANVSNIVDYNLRSEPSEHLPRILLIVNEFKLLDSKMEENLIKILNLYGTFGIHMYFMTQEFTKSLPDSIMNQFRVRICMRTPAEISECIIGSKVAASIMERGHCYSNEDGGRTQDTTKRWVFPYISYEETKNL